MALMDFFNDPPPPFICLVVEAEAKNWYPKKKIGETTYLVIDKFDISDVQYEKVLHSHQLHLLPFHYIRLALRAEEYRDQFCSACRSYKTGMTYYSCNECDNYYHKECAESPPTFIFSYHPKYPLQLLTYYEGTSPECFYCGLKMYGLVYYSYVYDLFMDPLCSKKQKLSAIHNPERHEHTLHHFPRKASLICDVCASDDTKNCLYSCLQCDFAVHKRCIDLPYVIQISCHSHRLSFTNPLPSGNDHYCGVCRRKINKNYGSYSCTRCSYAVHTKCATSLDIWAVKELKDQPELEDDNIELSFEKMGDGIIRHFSHAHHRMRLIEDIERVFDAKQQYCRACILPFYDGNIYKCMEMECDFALHEACANLPRIKHVVVHEDQLVLKPVITDIYFWCRFCKRFSCGFGYKCDEGCWDYYLDVRCASISELVDHPSHPHPLFLFYQQQPHQKCSACERVDVQCLNCIDHDFVLCFYCASLPYKFKCEHDEHTLTLSYEKIASGPPCWCQICEETTNPKKGYYTCNECGVTFHIKCILGNDIYMKEGHVSYYGCKLEILPNNRLSRPICNRCQKRCQYNITFKNQHGNIFCSLKEAIFSG